jgi:hypothetical protein
MPIRFFRRALLALALSAPLAACLEPYGRPAYNPSPAAPHADLCRASAQSVDNVAAYNCAPKQ